MAPCRQQPCSAVRTRPQRKSTPAAAQLSQHQQHPHHHPRLLRQQQQQQQQQEAPVLVSLADIHWWP